MARERADVDAAALVTFPRDVFINEVFDYSAGEHVTVLAPTGGGKTQLAYGLLGAVATPDLQAVVFVMKPKDSTVAKFTARFKFKTVRDWPPGPGARLQKKPPGYVLWPKETDNPDQDDWRHEHIFRRAIRALYKRGNSIIFADETYSLEQELGLKDDLRRVWTKGRSIGTGLWAASQRPVWISLWAFQAQHLFLGNDPDQKARERYGEIGAGFDPELIRTLTARLERYQFLYINREERTMCIVDA